MTSAAPDQPAEERLSAEVVGAREFSRARKGYDRGEVRAFLAEVASAIEAAAERIVDLERRLARAAVEAEGTVPGSEGDAEMVLDETVLDETVLEAVSAEAWRDDVLADLDRRRRELNAEIVRLRAGRDRLRGDLSEVLSGVDEQLRLLDGALAAARAAGDVEEQRVRAEPSLSPEERRAELEAARLAGFVTVGSRARAETGADPRPAGADDADSLFAHPNLHQPQPPPTPAGADEADSLFARLRAERTTVRPE